MKLRKKAILSAVISSVMIAGLTVSASFAGVTCVDTTVQAAGNSPFTTNTLKVKLVCNDASPAWTGSKTFYIGDGQSNEMYATALTAIASGKSCEVNLGSATEGSKMFVIILNET